MRIQEISRIALCAALIFAQEQLLAFLPNIQLTTLLILLFARLFSLKQSLLLVIVYVMLDHLANGSFSLFYTPAALVGWSLLPVSMHSFLKRANLISLALFGFFFGFLYGWCYFPARMIEWGIGELWPYFLADLPFELLMGATNFITILWLYEPLLKRIKPWFEHHRIEQA